MFDCRLLFGVSERRGEGVDCFCGCVRWLSAFLVAGSGGMLLVKSNSVECATMRWNFR